MRCVIRVLTSFMILSALCFVMASCDESTGTETSTAASSVVSVETEADSTESAVSHFTPVASGEVSDTGDFSSTEPTKYDPNEQC